MHITVQQATEQYKVSIRTLRTLTAGLTAEQKAKYLIIKGKHHLISTELLKQHYQPRTGEQMQNKDAKQVQSDRAATDAPPSHTASDAKQMQSEAAKVQNDFIVQLKNEIALLHDRLKEANFIAANLSRQQIAPPPPTDTPGPKPNTTTDTPFLWFIVGLVFGILVLGLVVVIYN